MTDRWDSIGLLADYKKGPQTRTARRYMEWWKAMLSREDWEQVYQLALVEAQTYMDQHSKAFADGVLEAMAGGMGLILKSMIRYYIQKRFRYLYPDDGWNAQHGYPVVGEQSERGL